MKPGKPEFIPNLIVFLLSGAGAFWLYVTGISLENSAPAFRFAAIYLLPIYIVVYIAYPCLLALYGSYRIFIWLVAKIVGNRPDRVRND